MSDYPQVLFRNRKPDRIATLAEYRQSGGYEALSDAVRNKSPRAIEEELLAAQVLGRGGAGFPSGKKLMAVAEDAPFPRYIVCNADEMEPGTFKDRVLIHADPHQLLEGIALAGYAITASVGVIFIRPEYEGAARILEREIGLAKKAGCLGNHIFGSGFSFDIVVHRSAGRYICGEGTAQLNALQARRPNPKLPPPYATEKGLWGKPTVQQNVETLCCMPHVIRNGAAWFKALSLTPTGAGTKIYGVSGKVRRPGCYELPMGIPLREIIEVHAGGMIDGLRFKACLPGGASTRFMTEADLDLAMDFESLKAKGHRLGTGAVMVFDEQTCLVGATLNLITFFARESCGWCTPCREGLPYVRDLLWRIENGMGEPWFVGALQQMSRHLWQSYCALAPGAASPLESLLTCFPEEVEDHIRHKRCRFSSSAG
jgi:NADH-quinone oxidoreductase subunit F